MNKNTRLVRRLVAAAGRKGLDSVTIQVPVRDWHNREKQEFNSVTIPTARMNNEGLVSANKRRNSAMRIYHNTAPNGTSSLTVHEPYLKHERMTYPNHAYLKYEKRAA